MRNIYETDGLSREKRAARVAMDFPLDVLEANTPALLTRVLRKSKEFSQFYHYQPIVVLSEIEHIDTEAIQEVFYFLQDEEEKVYYIRTLLLLMEGWRQRLESFSLYSGSLELLRDLTGQIETNLAPWFPHFVSFYNVEFEPGQMGSIWYPVVSKNRNDIMTDGFFRRFFYLFLASVSVLCNKVKVYKDEIYSTGTMDPSLAVLITFLDNYSEIVSRFNHKWRELPLFYYNQILKTRPRPEKKGKTWLSFRKKAIAKDFVIPAGSYFPATGNACFSGYKLTEDLPINGLSVEKVSLVVAGKSKERYPEAALDYITSLSRIHYPECEQENLPIGIQLKSEVFLLGEGSRQVTVFCSFTDESLDYLHNIILNIAQELNISEEEARLKIGEDAFSAEVTTAQGWMPVPHLIVHIRPDSGIEFRFNLDSFFPAVVSHEAEGKPSVRMLINPGAWLFAYSWAKKMFIRKIHIRVDVSGIRNIVMCNELGIIDTTQPFIPFGNMGQRGAWFVFGNYEIVCKRTSKVVLDFLWQHIPDQPGGLDYYYKEYRNGIDNRSFRVSTHYLHNNEWKTVPDAGSQYLFRTEGAQGNVPEPDSKLSTRGNFTFNLPEIDDFGIRSSGEYVFGRIHSGFFRIMLTEPDMGFGEKEYRRIFTETLIQNSRKRRKSPLPQEPLAPVMDGPQLSYSAEETCHFTIGQTTPVEISYIRPLSDRVELTADISRPIPLVEGPEDEGNLMIGFRNAMGENLFSFYLETEPLQKQNIYSVPDGTNWYFKDISRWVKIQPSFVLTDNTGSLRHSGKVEIQLPVPVSSQMLDSEGLFWLCLAVNGLDNCAIIRNIYTQVAEAEVTDRAEKTGSFPGLEEYRQISAVSDARPPESDRELSIRLRERISHRNRALLPQDYEQLILQEFPQVQKVKCLPGIDTEKESGRQAVVSVVVINERDTDEWPLCEDKLLTDIGCFIISRISPFVHVNVVNPIYEEVTVFCGITLKKGYSTGTVITGLRKSIRKCIAAWADTDGLPVFGYSFSVNELQSIIVENKGVEQLHGIKLIHQKENRTGDFFANEYVPEKEESYRICPSEPWAILVPACNQYIIVCTPDEWRERVEYGDLELGSTFVIG